MATRFDQVILAPRVPAASASSQDPPFEIVRYPYFPRKFFYPLHDEPHDYWRFTEHALRMLLADFSEVRIDCSGPRKAPVFYFATAIK